MTELLETCVNGLLKSSLGVLVGMQMIRNLIAPALDSLRQMALWRTAGMIPGIGNAVECCNRVGGRLRGADPQLLWRDGNAGTARSRHGSRRSASRFGSFLPTFSPRRRSPSRTSGSRDVLRRQEKDMRCFCVSF